MPHEVEPGHRASIPSAAARAAGLALGVAADAAFGDPPNRWHPVAWFGTWAAWLERRTYADTRAAGVGHVALALAPVAAIGVAAEAVGRRRPLLRLLLTGVATWAVIGARSLADEGERMADALAADDLAAARDRLPHLCGRVPDELDAAELSRATIESLAENAADSVVASLWWGALAGVPGLLLHRAANTLDAMIGHHNERYENFGWAAARLDDLLDYVPARLTGTLAAALAPSVGGATGGALSIMLRDGRDHPSPNGGWCEAAFAGALGVRLGGRNTYPGGRVERRGLLGDGDRPTPDDARRAARLLRGVTKAATALATGLTALAAGAAALSSARSNRRPAEEAAR